METQSPGSVDSRRKRRRFSNSNSHDPANVRRPSETASSTGELGSMRRGLSKGSSSFVGSGSGIYFVHTVQAAFARNYSRQGSEAINDDLVPGEDDRLHTRNQSGTLWSIDEIESVSLSQEESVVTFEEMVAWSQPYFDNWHPPFPFLVGSSVLNLFEKVSQSGMGSLNQMDSTIVRSVLSISLADKRQMPAQQGRKIPDTLIFRTADDAISCLTPILLQPSTIGGLQSLVAIQIFLISMLHLNAASRIGGLIVRVAFHLGLHRCPTKYEQFSQAESDLRRRIFWAIYVLERYLSHSLGLPLDLRDDDIDVCYPDRELHYRSDHPHGLNVDEAPNPRLLLLPALLARHGKIRGMTLELRHIALKSRTTDPDEVAMIEAEISKWWNEAQDLAFDDVYDPAHDNKDALLSPALRLLLVVQKHESVILLNRPVITSGKNTSMFAAAMQKCIGASKQIVSKVYQHLCSGMDEAGSKDGKLKHPLFWPGFTWCVWMSGLILVYAASEGHYSVQVAQREAERCIEILETLSLRGSFWPGACATALRDLQKALTNKNTSTVSTTATTNGARLHGEDMSNMANFNDASSHNLAGADSRQGHNFERQNVSSAPPNTTSTYNSQAQHQQADGQPMNTTYNNGNENILQPTMLEQNSFGQQGVTDFGFENWQGVGFNLGQLPPGDGNYEGFNDIFQLMDVSYQMSEQMYDPNMGMPRY